MIDDSKHSREAYRVEQSLAARHYEKEIKTLERKVKVLSEALENCKDVLSCLGEPFDSKWSRLRSAVMKLGFQTGKMATIFLFVWIAKKN